MTWGPRHVVLVQAGLGAGGTEKIVQRLAAHLVGRGNLVTVLAISGAPEDSYYPMPDDVNVRTLEAELGGRAARNTRARVAWLRRVIRQSRSDVVVSFLTKINIQVAAACTGLDVARIASERNNFMRQPMNGLWRRALPLALGAAHGVVMQTDAARRALPRRARRRAVVIGNPAEAPRLIPVTAPPRRLVATGRLSEQKGFDVLLAAVAHARAEVPDLSLTIWGEGEERRRLEALRDALGLEDAVEMPGRSATPHGWIGAGGIFVLSSRYEGFPNVLVEAMAAGMAPVAADCDWGPGDLIADGENGLLVSVGDARALAAALVRLWRDDVLRARLSRAARTRAADFAEPCILAQWDAVIDAAAQSRDRVRPTRSAGPTARRSNG